MNGPGPERDSRGVLRFNVRRPLPAQFLGLETAALNLSGGGLQIEHTEPLKLGAHGPLRVDDVSEGETLTFQARVVWSHLSRNIDPSGKFLYRSGLFLLEPPPSAIGALGRLVHTIGQPDRDSIERKKESDARKSRSLEAVPLRSIEVTAEQLEVVRRARQFLQLNSEEALKWQNRAKFSAAHGAAPELPYRAEVLALWEYTGRVLPLPTIVRALEMLK